MIGNKPLEILFVTVITVFVLMLVIPVNTEEPATEPEEVTTEAQPLYGTVEYVTEVPTEEWVGSVADFQPIDCSLDEEVQEFIYYLSAGYEIDFYFIMGVIACESGYQADVISKTNDYGLMQINQCNHEWMSETLGITDFLDPYQNVMAGTFRFHQLFTKYEGDTAKVLMAYNMGEGGASRLWEQGVYESNYSRRVMQKIVELKEGV